MLSLALPALNPTLEEIVTFFRVLVMQRCFSGTGMAKRIALETIQVVRETYIVIKHSVSGRPVAYGIQTLPSLNHY